MARDDNILNDGNPPETSNTSPPVPPPTQQIPHIVSSIKLPILKKREYDIWAMKMEHFLSHTDYPIWQIHGDGVSHEDANQKFLRSLPFSWSQVALIMITKPELDTLSFNDLYNNLRVFERDVKGTTVSSSNTHNVTFVSAKNTSSTNDGILLETAELNETKTAEEEMLEALKEKEDLKTKFENWQNSSKNLSKLLNTLISVNDKFELGYGDYRYGSTLSYENEVLQSVFMNKVSDLEDTPINGLKQTAADESDSKPSEYASCESDSSVETSTSMPEPVENASKVVCEPKVWTGAPIIEGYESDSDNNLVSNVQEDKEKPSFAFSDSVKHVKTSRKNIKETGTTNHSPKIEKHDRNGHTRKGLGYDFTGKACFVCGSFSHLIRDCDFHEQRMAKQAELTKSKNKVTGQRENRPVWNDVQRVNHQNKFVSSVLLTKTGKILVNAARQTYSSQAASTSTASKVNRPFVNETRPKRNFYKIHSPNKRPFHNTTTQRTTFSYQKVNVVRNKALSVVGGSGDTADDPHRALKDNEIVDSGCSRHMIGNKAHLADYQKFKGGYVAFGGSNGRITGKGKIKTGMLDFEDVYYVEELKHYNLFSVFQMCNKKNKVLFTDTYCLVLSPDFKLPDENQVLLKIPRQQNVYSFNLKNINPSRDLACLFVKASIDESNKWHRRLGHVNFKNLNKLVKGNLVRGLPSKIFKNDYTCVACQKRKQHKASCKAKTVSSVNQPLQILHMDLFGPTSVRSINHKTYFLVITDGFSRIKREYSNARTPQQNRVAERKNMTLIEATRTMLADSFLPTIFWAEAVNTACYVFNRVLVTKPQNKTPYELLTVENQANKSARPKEANNSAGTQANDDQGANSEEIDLNEEHFVLPIWSAYPTTVKSSRDKIEKNTGFKTCEKLEATHNIQNASTNSTNLINTASTPLSTTGPSRTFNDDELSYLNPSKYALLDDPSMPHLEDIYASPSEGIFTYSSYDDEGVVTDFNNLKTTVSVNSTPTTRIHTIHPKTQILRDPKSAIQTRSKVNKNSKAHALVSYIQKQQRNNHKDFHHCLFACFLSQTEPKKISQALEFESWVDDMQEELPQFQIQKVWILVDLPFGKKAIGTKWVYKNKKNEKGVVVRNKARLVAQGHRQEERIDYDEVFAPVAKIESIRIFLDFASYMGFIVYQMDSAFLYGTINEEVYVSQPPGFVDPKFSNKVFKKSWCDEFEELMKNRFQMSFMGELTFFLGLQKPLVKDEEATDMDVHLYRSMIGSLMYLTASRPDIMFAVCACSRKSTTRGSQFLGRRLISWQCKKQTIVATYTTEAEYVDVAHCCGQNPVFHSKTKHIEIRHHFIRDSYEKKLIQVLKIHTDDNVVDLLTKAFDNPVFHSKTKHIKIRHHFIRDSYEKKLIQVLKIHTDDNVVDLLTKAFDVSSKELVSPKQTALGKDISNPLMGCRLPKTTLPTSTMASAIIFLATNQKFNFSRYILLSLVKNIEAGVSFFMFSRFVTLLIDHQLGDMSHHKDIYDNPSLTKKVCASMKRVGTGFSGVVTPLFNNMLVPTAKEVGLIQDDVQLISIHTEPSTSKPHKKHKPKKQQTQAHKVPSLEPSPEHMLASPSNDALPGGKDSLELKELMDLCTHLSNKVLELKSEVIAIKSTYKERIEKLEGRVDKLKEEIRVLKELHSIHSKVDTVAPFVEKEKSFKQGRIIANIDENVEINLEEAHAKPYRMDLEHPEKVLSMQDVDDEEPAEVEEVLEVVTATKLITEVVTTARATTTAKATKVSVSRRKRGVVIQDPEETTSTVVVHSEVQSKDKEKVMKYQALKRKPLTEAQARKNMIIYLKNMTGYKMNYFKGEEGIDYEEVFTPVARIEAIRLFLAYASFMGFLVYQMDVMCAFLYGTIEEEVYLYQPLGFEDPDYPDKVYKVVKALYGLHQAPRACQDKYLAEILRKVGLTNRKSASTPIDTEKSLLKDPDGEDVDVHTYRSMIGSLMYLTSSRPDIMFATSIAVKKVNVVMRLQALVDKKKVVILEASIRDALRLDDAKGVECLPNEEIFAELARMGYEKPSTKLIFYKMFFSRQWKFLIHIILQCMSAKRTSWNEFSSSMASAVICLSTGKGFSRVETPLFEGMIVDQQVDEGDNEVHDEGVPAAGVVAKGVVSAADDVVPTAVEEPFIPSPTPPTPPPQPSQDQPSTSQERIITDIDADKDVILEDAKEVVVEKSVDVDESADIQGRKAESQAQIYQIDLKHANKVLSMQDDKGEPAELQEVVDVVTTAKLITEVVTAAKEPKPLKKQAQIKQDEANARELEAKLNKNIDWDEVIDHVHRKQKEDNAMKRYQALKRKPQTEAQARKNMMIYLKNTKEQIDEEYSRAVKRLNESQEDKAVKKEIMDEEVEELRRHLQIVPNDEDDVYTEATPLVRKVLVVDCQELEAVRVMWCANYHIHYNTVDFAGREKISAYKVYSRSDGQ
nr:hypothetical protein [Tanacetum cinerariifolium]